MHLRLRPYTRISGIVTSVMSVWCLLACSSTERPEQSTIDPDSMSTRSVISDGSGSTGTSESDATSNQSAAWTLSDTTSATENSTQNTSSAPSSNTVPTDVATNSETVASTISTTSTGSESHQTSTDDSSTRPPETPVDAFAMAIEMGVGTNIGNTLENTTQWETGWGQPLVSRDFINGIASRGLKTVRVPVAWDTYATNGQIDQAKFDRVREVVDWIHEAGLFAVVNIHWDGGWIFNEHLDTEFQLTDEVRTKFEGYWTQIAAGFADVGHQLIFEGMNEEGRFFVGGDSTGTPDYAPLNELNQLFVTTVRAQGGYNESRGLLVAGFQTDITLTCVDSFRIPDDPAGPNKLFLSLHYYTPYTFCGLDTVETWGSPATTWGTDAERSELETLFDTLGSFSEARNIPIILGEFGVTPGEAYPREPASRSAWMGAVTNACLSRGMVPLLWDTGSEITRVDGSFSPEWEAVINSL
jgi:endoglucanase